MSRGDVTALALIGALIGGLLLIAARHGLYGQNGENSTIQSNTSPVYPTETVLDANYQTDHIQTFTDKETGIMYYVNTQTGTMTVRLQPDGSPYIDPEFEE